MLDKYVEGLNDKGRASLSRFLLRNLADINSFSNRLVSQFEREVDLDAKPPYFVLAAGQSNTGRAIRLTFPSAELEFSAND